MSIWKEEWDIDMFMLKMPVRCVSTRTCFITIVRPRMFKGSKDNESGKITEGREIQTWLTERTRGFGAPAYSLGKCAAMGAIAAETSVRMSRCPSDVQSWLRDVFTDKKWGTRTSTQNLSSTTDAWTIRVSHFLHSIITIVANGKRLPASHSPCYWGYQKTVG